MDEAEIRDLVASDLTKIDSKLVLVATEHEIVLPDGRRARIDILAKDHFGCFTVIEIKKSGATARSTIQQLFTYAHFLKSKNRLRADQIVCVAAATHWEALRAPFSEFKEFSDYQSLALQLEIISATEYRVHSIETPFEEGGGEAMRNFIFFEFKTATQRGQCFDRFIQSLLDFAPHLNSVVVRLDSKSENLPNPFGFSWTTFKSHPASIEDDLAKLQTHDLVGDEYFSASPISASWQDGSTEAALRDRVIETAPLMRRGDGEFGCFAIHSLNNTLQQWDTRDAVLHGPMFDDNLFGVDEAIELACGFIGTHPYNFVANTSPSRAAHFKFVRKRLDVFLAANPAWKKAASIALDSIAGESEVGIRIYNPLNFFGMLVDLYSRGQTQRIPHFQIIEKQESGAVIGYFGTVIWNGGSTRVKFLQALRSIYKDESIALMRAVNQWMNQYDERLFRKFSITHEAYRLSDGATEWLNLGVDPAHWEKITKDTRSIEAFFHRRNDLIEDAGRWFSTRSVAI